MPIAVVTQLGSAAPPRRALSRRAATRPAEPWRPCLPPAPNHSVTRPNLAANDAPYPGCRSSPRRIPPPAPCLDCPFRTYPAETARSTPWLPRLCFPGQWVTLLDCLAAPGHTVPCHDAPRLGCPTVSLRDSPSYPRQTLAATPRRAFPRQDRCAWPRLPIRSIPSLDYPERFSPCLGCHASSSTRDAIPLHSTAAIPCSPIPDGPGLSTTAPTILSKRGPAYPGLPRRSTTCPCGPRTSPTKRALP